jgi:FkbM family methyltransferase
MMLRLNRPIVPVTLMSNTLSRLLRALKFDAAQLASMWRKAATPASFARFASDLLRLRLLRLLGATPSGRERRIRLRDGTRLTYRLNYGDVQSIREVWLEEGYRLPFPPLAGVLVDLGANIGLTSVWLAKRYRYETIIAVEPSPANARLVRINFADNGIAAEVVEAAVGPADGTAFFDDDEASNLGRVSARGRPVRMLSMESVLRMLPAGTPIDLVKMDIEGGEEALLRGTLDWLGRVRSLIAEFHPAVIDYPRAVQVLQQAGFRYIAAGSAHKGSMDSFVRGERLA